MTTRAILAVLLGGRELVRLGPGTHWCPFFLDDTSERERVFDPISVGMSTVLAVSLAASTSPLQVSARISWRLIGAHLCVCVRVCLPEVN